MSSRNASVLTRLNRIVKDLVDGLNILIRWRMEDDDDRSNEADGATKLSKRAELFSQEIRAENGTNENTQSAQGCYQNRRREGICSKVANLSDAHYVRAREKCQ